VSTLEGPGPWARDSEGDESIVDDATRKKLNGERLLLVDTSIRAQARAVLTDMEGLNMRPLIAPEVWRSPALQLQKFREGTSKLKWGFHCATTQAGKPASLAADIVDANKLWGASQEFWLKLGSCALAHDLGWGGFWGLPANVRVGLTVTLERKQWKAKVKLGWDVAHVETTRVTVAEARAGKR
jgi:hypothetical protein